MEDENLDSKEDVSRMFMDGKELISLDDELAFFMHRFNLDADSVKTMPAFEEHCKSLFHPEKIE